MTIPNDLRAQAERCRRVGSRYGGGHQAPMNHLAAQLEAQAQSIEETTLARLASKDAQ